MHSGYLGVTRNCKLLKQFRIVVLVLMMSGNALASTASATEWEGVSDTAVNGTHVTVISLPGLSFLELEPASLMRYPALRSLAADSDVAAMNVRLPVRGAASVYATWGAGSPADARGIAAGRRARPDLPWLHNGATPELAGKEGDAGSYSSLSAPAMLEPALGDNGSSWTVPGLGRMQKRSRRGGFRAVPGALAQRLGDTGVRTGVWRLVGTEERTEGIAEGRRPFTAALMMMNEQGKVAAGGGAAIGQVSSLLYRSWNQVVEAAGNEPAEGRIRHGTLNVLEYDGIARAFSPRGGEGQDERKAGARLDKAMLEADRLLAFVRSAVTVRSRQRPEERQVIWLVSPEINPIAQRAKKLLTPVLRWSPSLDGVFSINTVSEAGKPTRMSSASTYRPGIVAAVDLAPSLLREFGLPASASMVGLPIYRLGNGQADGPLLLSSHSASSGSVLNELMQELEGLSWIYKLRPPLLYGLVVFEIVIMVAGLFAGWGLMGRGRIRIRCVSFLLLAILWIPALLVAMGGTIGSPVRGAALALLALSLGIAGWRRCSSLYLRQAMLRVLAAAGIGTSVLILADAMWGAPLMKHSVLGYDAMIGARYYGIGNECMGVLLGSSLLAVSMLLELRRRHPAQQQERPAQRGKAYLAAWPAVVAGLLTTGTLAAPGIGANAGGALAAAAGFGVLAARLAAGGPLRWRGLSLALAGPLAAALFGLWLLNAAAPPAPAGGSGSAAAAMATVAAEQGDGRAGADAGHGSHIGRAFTVLLQGRWDDIGAIIERKLAMNLHLLRVSAWSKVLLTGLAVMAALLLRPKGRLRAWERSYPFLMHGCYANVLGSFAALALNDSGIVAAAAMIVYGCVPLLLLRLRERAAEAEAGG
ncbi:hypothetical protein WMW72_24660 [Paenibacillus filicis]|uniref:Uncharacterized protein n=1 Tax=Paenibacillus filicis TaxID=669464 RepID=A0ABU9DSQ3_9BACL